MTPKQRIALATSVGILSFIAMGENAVAREKQRPMNFSDRPSRSADKPTFGEKFMMGLKKFDRTTANKRLKGQKR